MKVFEYEADAVKSISKYKAKPAYTIREEDQHVINDINAFLLKHFVRYNYKLFNQDGELLKDVKYDNSGIMIKSFEYYITGDLR